MSKICRTCLRKSKKTFNVNQAYEFGSSAAKISYVLRFCIPELYLGLSTNPEICFDCKRSLEVAYVFKKKCLNTEQLLGEYLKTIRCTGKSIELQDVLKYFHDKSKLGHKPQVNLVNAQDIISEWEELDGEGTTELPLIEVRQSAPNPTNFFSSEEIKFCEDTYLLYKHNKLSNVSKSEQDEICKTQSDTDAQLDRAIKNEQKTGDFPKITSVYSLSEIPNPSLQNLSDISDAVLDVTTSNTANTEVGAPMHGINKVYGIKDEPLDVELNSDQIKFSYNSTDEETLDASETASYENAPCDSTLQGLIDSLPRVTDYNQYVDVPDLVQINNFGPKELEELRRQQLKDAQSENNTEQVGFKLEPGGLLCDCVQEKCDVNEVKDNSLPQTLFINGQQMVKCAEGYRFLGDGRTAQQIELEANTKPSKLMTVATQVDSRPILKRRIGRPKKLKIVPIDSATSSNKPKSLLTADDKNIVVLFTNYTSNGFYVNDHDYLINPYKRNKILIEKGNEWLCMCYICHKEHTIQTHVSHMRKHSSFCKICEMDLGTSLMLNGHVREHVRPCKQCTQRVPYGLIESHNRVHLEEEIEYQDTKKRPYRRRKMSRDGKSGSLSVAPAAEICETDTAMEAGNGDSVVKDEPKEQHSSSVTPTTPVKRHRKRRIKIEECSPSEANYRVLRSKPRKSYNETDLNIANSASLSYLGHISPGAESP